MSNQLVPAVIGRNITWTLYPQDRAPGTGVLSNTATSAPSGLAYPFSFKGRWQSADQQSEFRTIPVEAADNPYDNDVIISQSTIWTLEEIAGEDIVGSSILLDALLISFYANLIGTVLDRPYALGGSPVSRQIFNAMVQFMGHGQKYDKGNVIARAPLKTMAINTGTATAPVYAPNPGITAN